jgi:TonB-linked SusC/RagA family outer membrane protein
MTKKLQLHKLLLFTMKVSFIYFLFTMILIGIVNANNIAAQVLDKKVTIDLQNVTIRKALERLSRETEAKFLYHSQLVSSAEKVSLSVTEERLAAVLEKILTPFQITFEAEGNQIVLTRQKIGFLQEGFLPETSKNSVNAIQVTGSVKDDKGMPLPGVSIAVKGSTNGTTTDANGSYSIAVDDGNAVLVFSFIGFTSQEVVVGTQTEINISLAPDLRMLDEVVVIGYGEVKKSDLTGSVASVKSEELNAYPVTNVVQSLAGRATGVHVSQNTGAPGSPISVRIRGSNSVLGSNEPLYVVDGFPYSGNPTLLSNADIESVEVLKDASATAIYGSRGANGVVLITTKRGQAGAMKIDYEGYVGSQTLRKKLDLMNAREYAEFYNEVAANDSQPQRFTQAQIDALGEGTDWQDVVFRTAPIQSHAVTLSGGSESTRFSVGLSNFKQDGIIKNNDYVRNSLRFSLNTKLSKKFAFDLNNILSIIDSERKNSGGGNRGNSLISGMLAAYPTVEARNPDGTFTNLITSYTWGSNNLYNPLGYIEAQSDHLRSNKSLTNGALTYKPIEGLSVKISAGLENTDDRTDFYQTRAFIGSTGDARIGTGQIRSVLSENTVSYVKDVGKHNVSAVAGFTYQNSISTSLSAGGTTFISDNQESFDLGAAENPTVPGSSYTKWVLLSYLGRVNYSFNDKILTTVSFRTDGSSRYSENQKWGSFPSLALAWRLSEEDFIKNISAISNLKIRVGYGQTGSTAIEPYQTLDQLVTGKAVVKGDELSTTYAPGSRLAGPLKWETTTQTDFGIDIGLLENRINITVDYYFKDTEDLLNRVELPVSQGYTYTIRNIGKVQNKGLEFSVNAHVFDGPFKWELTANLSRNRNKVVELYDGVDVFGDRLNLTFINDYLNILRVGEPIGSFYGYVSTGYNATGFVTYEDNNSNTLLDVADKKIIGNPNPDFVYGFNSTMSFKNFELGVFIQGTQGNDIFNASKAGQANDYGFGLNMLREVYESHWSTEKTDAKYPVLKATSQPQISDRFIEDGSYMRVKNIQLSYNLPVSTLNLNWLRRAQLYVSGQNLITFTKYSWYDPEINSYGGANSFQQGIDHYSYPTAKTVTAGIRIGL